MADDPDPTSAGDLPESAVVEGRDVRARYVETDAERQLRFERDARVAVVAQNREGYAMLAVRTAPDGEELERYYGLEMALDHVAELLAVRPDALPIPEPAADMGL